MATLKNTTINDTGHITPATGTTVQRPATPVLGSLRYNSTIGILEQYTDVGWQGIESPPVITGFSGVINSNTNTTITVNGSNFKSGSIVSIDGAAVTGSRSLTTTFVSSSQLTANTNAASVNYTGGNTFDVKVTNPSGLQTILATAGTVDRDPVFSTSTGNLGTIFDSNRTASFTISASDPDGQTVTYSVASGSLPTGMSLNSSTGVISGTASAVGSDTTFTFDIRASSTSGSLTSTEDRSFNIIVKAPVVTSFTSTGSQTFSVPTGLTSVQVLVVAGGAGGGAGAGYEAGGGGGAGGVIFSSSTPVTPGGSVSVTVGSGGSSQTNTNGTSLNPAANGNNSSFGPITATGGGAGGGQYYGGQDGGSGGGRGGNSASQPIGNGTPGQGNPGAAGTENGTDSYGGGGGGAGGAGGAPPGGQGGVGGSGYTTSISGSSITYGGGGGGAGSYGGGPGGPGGSGGGGNGSSSYTNNQGNGTTNRGGGGGGSCAPNGSSGSTGGPGIVIVKY